MGLLQPIGYTQQKFFFFLFYIPSPTHIPPNCIRLSLSFCPLLALWSSQADASCLCGSCDTVLCSLIGIFLHNRPQVINQKDESKCGTSPSEGSKGPSDKGHGKGSAAYCILCFSSLERSFHRPPKYLWQVTVSGTSRCCPWQEITESQKTSIWR